MAGARASLITSSYYDYFHKLSSGAIQIACLGSWLLLGTFGGFGRVLARLGASWRCLALPDSSWRVLALAQLLAASGTSWEPLAAPGCPGASWRPLTVPGGPKATGISWRLLGSWQLLAAPGSSGKLLAALGARGPGSSWRRVCVEATDRVRFSRFPFHFVPFGVVSLFRFVSE